MNRPLVSVAMVVCNVDRFLGEAIQSIIDQSYTDLEFIITDFGSTDKSKSIVLDYQGRDSRIHFHSIPHCGLSEARNAGCAIANGKYIAIMDADDVALPDRLKLQVDFMERNEQIGVVGGSVEWIDASGKSVRIADNPTSNRELQAVLLERCPLWQPSVLIRREAFRTAGGYRHAFAAAADYDLWLRIAERFHVANLKDILLKYRIHPHQISLRKVTQQTYGALAAQASTLARRAGKPDVLDSAREITPALLKEMGVSDATLQTTLAREYFRWIRNMFAAGEYTGAMTAAGEMFKASDWKYAERWVIADVRLLMARMFLKENKFIPSGITLCRAVLTRPLIVGRPVKQLLRSLRPASHPARNLKTVQ